MLKYVNSPTELQSTSSKTDRIEKRSRQMYHYSWDFNTPLNTVRTCTHRQKLNKDREHMNSTNQLYLIDTYRILHMTTAEYSLLSSVRGKDRPYSNL